MKPTQSTIPNRKDRGGVHRPSCPRCRRATVGAAPCVRPDLYAHTVVPHRGTCNHAESSQRNDLIRDGVRATVGCPVLAGRSVTRLGSGSPERAQQAAVPYKDINDLTAELTASQREYSPEGGPNSSRGRQPTEKSITEPIRPWRSPPRRWETLQGHVN